MGSGVRRLAAALPWLITPTGHADGTGAASGKLKSRVNPVTERAPGHNG